MRQTAVPLHKTGQPKTGQNLNLYSTQSGTLSEAVSKFT